MTWRPLLVITPPTAQSSRYPRRHPYVSSGRMMRIAGRRGEGKPAEPAPFRPGPEYAPERLIWAPRVTLCT